MKVVYSLEFLISNVVALTLLIVANIESDLGIDDKVIKDFHAISITLNTLHEVLSTNFTLYLLLFKAHIPHDKVIMLSL
jgi:hypothetical protein